MTLEQAPPIYPDVTLDAALRLLADHALLCVVSRANPQVPIGVVSILDVRRAYGFPESGPMLPETPAASEQHKG